jgi:hypothetical protein
MSNKKDKNNEKEEFNLDGFGHYGGCHSVHSGMREKKELLLWA